jgi:hypothetical protein
VFNDANKNEDTYLFMVYLEKKHNLVIVMQDELFVY